MMPMKIWSPTAQVASRAACAKPLEMLATDDQAQIRTSCTYRESIFEGWKVRPSRSVMHIAFRPRPADNREREENDEHE